MVVIWSKSAKKDLKKYIKNSKIQTKSKLNNYIINLLLYANTLKRLPKLGKVLYIYKNIEIRQLIFKMHKIIYYIVCDKIIIIMVTHTSRDLTNIIKSISNYFK